MMKMNKSIFVMQCRLSSVDDDDAGLKLWFSSISVYSLWFWTFIYRLIRRHLNVELKTKTSPMCAGGSHLVDEHIKKNMQIRLNRLLNWMIELQCGWSHSIAASFSLFASSSVGYATSNNFSFSTFVFHMCLTLRRICVRFSSLTVHLYDGTFRCYR